MPKNRKIDGELINGFFMKKKKSIPTLNETIYHCIERNTKYKCPAAFGVNDLTKTIRIIQPHINHEMDKLSNSVNLARQSIKKNANSGSPRDVIDGVRAAFGTETSIMLGSYNSKRRLIDYEKSNLNSNKKVMDNGGKISGSYSETLRKTRFLVFDEDVNGKRFVGFASNEGLEILSNGNVCFVDGTFDCVPKGFTQLFSMHCYIASDVVRPVFFCLLPDKQMSTYSTLLQLMKNVPQLSNWCPGMVISDFESAIHSAFKDKFPNVDIHGCMFHLVQSWRRQAEKLKVYQEFIDGPYEEFWKLLKTLPFVHESDIPDYFTLILNHCMPLAVPAEMKSFIDYLLNNYIGGVGFNSTRFPPKLWSCTVQTASNIHRTTNTVETWHRLLQSVATIHNGFTTIKMSDLVTKMQKEERHTTMDYNELKINPYFQVNKSRKNSNIMKDGKLKKVVENIPEIPRPPLMGIAYLKAIFHAKK